MRKAVWACLPFALAVFLHQYLIPDTSVPWAALACLPVLGVGLLLRGCPRLAVLLCAGGFLAGALCFWLQCRFVKDPCENRVGESAAVSARVTDYPDIYEKSEYVTIRLTGPGVPHVRCRLASYVPGELASLEPGDLIRCEMRFNSASVRNGMEVDIYNAQGIFLRAVCLEEPVNTGRWRGSFLYGPRRLARAVILSCERLFPEDVSSFMTALLTGEKGPLYSDGERYYSLVEAGLAHVVAVSGVKHLLSGFYRTAKKPVIPALFGHRPRRCTPKLRFT